MTVKYIQTKVVTPWANKLFLVRGIRARPEYIWLYSWKAFGLYYHPDMTELYSLTTSLYITVNKELIIIYWEQNCEHALNKNSVATNVDFPVCLNTSVVRILGEEVHIVGLNNHRFRRKFVYCVSLRVEKRFTASIPQNGLKHL